MKMSMMSENKKPIVENNIMLIFFIVGEAVCEIYLDGFDIYDSSFDINETVTEKVINIIIDRHQNKVSLYEEKYIKSIVCIFCKNFRMQYLIVRGITEGLISCDDLNECIAYIVNNKNIPNIKNKLFKRLFYSNGTHGRVSRYNYAIMNSAVLLNLSKKANDYLNS